MSLGPRLNKNNYSFSPRDSLGIEGVAASMSADVCPIVNTVTPRAFYWPFMVWIYYDFYKYSGIKERNYTEFNKYLKRQDYFFVLATLLVEGDGMNLVGKTQAGIDMNESDGPYSFNPNYFKPRFGGMQYYNAGCITMRFVTDRDADNNTLSFPKLTPAGEEMALAFIEVIKDTEYYKSYRLHDIPVPKNVLEEYGQVISLNMKGFGKPKELLRKRLFNGNEKLQKCADYIYYLYHEYGVDSISLEQSRKLLFDHLTEDNRVVEQRDDLKDVMLAWEIIIGRMYFSAGLEMIWKPMLMLIEAPESLEDWIAAMLTTSDYEWDIDQSLRSVIDECNYDFDTREGMIRTARYGRDPELGLEDGLRIMLSIYNWLKSLDNMGEEEDLLYYGSNNSSISFAEFIDTVEQFKDHSIKEFMIFIMQKWLVEQHYITAFEKTLYDINGFFYEIIDGKYTKTHDFYIEFQRNRMIQLLQVMKDLDMLS